VALEVSLAASPWGAALTAKLKQAYHVLPPLPHPLKNTVHWRRRRLDVPTAALAERSKVIARTSGAAADEGGVDGTGVGSGGPPFLPDGMTDEPFVAVLWKGERRQAMEDGGGGG
jgi:hypothetical protein